MIVTHKFISTLADGTDARQVRPSNWNDEHNVELNLGAGITEINGQLTLATNYNFDSLVETALQE